MDLTVWGCVPCVLGECRRHNPPECLAEDCDRTAHSGRYCPTHYRHRRENRNSPIRRYGTGECGCGAPHYARGLCRRHYRARDSG